MTTLNEKTKTCQFKNITIHISREYGKTKQLRDIINALIIQNFRDNNIKSA